MKTGSVLIFCGLVTSLIPALASLPGGEFATYRYELLMSKNDEVCKHMGEVYNNKFARLFDYRKFPKTEQLGSGAMPPLASKYPSSAEFEAVSWQYPRIFTDDGKKSFALPVAEFDIDNDGKKEIVIKTQFFDGTPDGNEMLRIFKQGQLDLQRAVTWKELSTGQGNKDRPGILQWGAIMRPFMLNGTSYISVYNFSAPKSPVRKGAVHQPPQTMEVKKYIRGSLYQEDNPMVFDDVCRFNMLRLNN